MKHGFVKVAAGTPVIRVADCAHNAGQIIALMKQAEGLGVKVLTFPELCLTGSTCGDLFWQDTLLDGAERALAAILDATKKLEVITAIGLPLRAAGKVYSCAAVIQKGEVVALVPKTHLSGGQERHFVPGDPSCPVMAELDLGGERLHISLGPKLIACRGVEGLALGVELGEDLWAPDAPANTLAAQGATIILNLSADPEGAGRAAWRRAQAVSQSARLLCGYVYAGAGEGESTTDLVFAGHSMIAESGQLLAEERFGAGLVVSEVDVSRLCHERRRQGSWPRQPGFREQAPAMGWAELTVSDTVLTRPVSPMPFVPDREEERAERFEEILNIAALGLKKRLEHVHATRAVIGLSGGLDSTLAILTVARAFDWLGLDRKGIVAVTMPCFGTTKRTRTNAELLAEELGAELRVVDITAAVERHFADIGQDPDHHDVTYENAQARERTQVLMDLANQNGGLVIGTGDLSELALGWCTYNGDHMSMYAVNAGIPKTLMRHLVAHCAGRAGAGLAAVLRDILDTPVSPELLPPKDGEIAQRTEELVGPYELHDFFLYYAVRWGFAPRKVLRLAEYAFRGSYDRAVILQWLRSFYRRFFNQQFKRSCMPDGPGVGTVTLSPRGGWVMPSDAVAALWQSELEGLK